jgi:hypothetical protein
VRSLNEIQFEMQAAAANSGCPLTDFSPQSVGHTLFRALASVIQQSELQTESQDKSTDLLTATGKNLDRLASPFGLARKAAGRATGFALCVARETIDLLPQTILVEPNSGLQFLAGNEVTLELSQGIETTVPIYSAGIGNIYDLAAGTPLQIPALPNVSSAVGYERKYDNTACGSLSGGTQAESDNSLRSRLFALLRAGGTLSTEALRAAVLERTNVKDAFVSTPAPGIVSVVVRAIEPNVALLESIKEEFKNYCIGAIINVNFANVLPLTVEVELTPSLNLSLDEIKNGVRETIESFITTARLANALNPTDLKIALADYGTNITFETPSDIVTWGTLDFIELGELKIGFRI